MHREENKNSLLNKINKNSIITKDDILDAIRSAEENIDSIEDISIGTELYSFIIQKKDDYGYSLEIDDDKKNRILLSLDFGDLKDLLSEKEFKDLTPLISKANISFHGVKGVITEEDKDDNKKQYNFSIRYEAVSFPSLSKGQLSQHIAHAMPLISDYLGATLDAVYVG